MPSPYLFDSQPSQPLAKAPTGESWRSASYARSLGSQVPGRPPACLPGQPGLPAFGPTTCLAACLASPFFSFVAWAFLVLAASPLSPCLPCKTFLIRIQCRCPPARHGPRELGLRCFFGLCQSFLVISSCEKHRNIRGKQKKIRGKQKKISEKHRKIRGKHRKIREKHRKIRGRHRKIRGEHRKFKES